jgi:Mn-dependent DtxR family transcriptional regulator
MTSDLRSQRVQEAAAEAIARIQRVRQENLGQLHQYFLKSPGEFYSKDIARLLHCRPAYAASLLAELERKGVLCSRLEQPGPAVHWPRRYYRLRPSSNTTPDTQT